MKRRSTVSTLISQLPKIITKQILNYKVPKEELKLFEAEEKKDDVENVDDLRDLSNHSEYDLYFALNHITEINQLFVHCGPILININPGLNKVEGYLDLKDWYLKHENLPEQRHKPHLYSFVNYIYKLMCKENKSQVINLTGIIHNRFLNLNII